jgi:segregation and condensation protein A
VDYLIDINNFHGPLDLLLHLVKSKKQDIYEISTSVIIEEYLNYINTMKDLNIDVASEFLVMAATLIHLKSRMLLGSTEEETEEEQEFEINSEDELKNRILEYEKYKKMTEIFKELEEKRSEFYTKSPMSLKEFTNDTISNDGSVTVDDLVNALIQYKERINYQKPINTKITRRELSVEDQMISIKDKLKVNKKINFLELFEEVNKEYLIVTFLAILQMSKNDEIMIYQDNNFDNIVVESR